MTDLNDIPVFDRRFFDGQSKFTRIGNGAIGGKAAGLLLVEEKILARLEPDDSPYVEIAVPTSTVLTTDVFDRFIQRNDLEAIAISDAPDDRIAHAFQRAELPAEYVGDLRGLISAVHTPLAVRSSSMLEDALDHPFAGVYGTKMIPNNQIEEDIRFRYLEEAIKFVFATTFFAESKAYLRSIDRPLSDEKMAVIIQEVVGQTAGTRFYPCVSGVARSYNYYPTGNARGSDGVVSLALGLGKTIVDGGFSWSFSPAFPKAPPPFNNVGDLLKNTQTKFWAVNMGDPPPHDPILETEHMVEVELGVAESDGVLRYLVSTYDPASDRLNPGLDATGPRALTFAPLIASRLMPFNDLIRKLMDLSETALDSPVEIEFAINLDRSDALPARIGFLQVRPMMVSGEQIEIDPEELESPSVLLASEIVLGNGTRNDIQDIVFIAPEAFETTETLEMAKELEAINRELTREGRNYVLIGFGRWGTSDPPLGVPVAWGQISGARVIVEATLPDVQPDLSQGSHFFHNLLSFRVLYLSVEHHSPHQIDWDWLKKQRVIRESAHCTHIRAESPLKVRVDGSAGRGVIDRHDEI